MFFHVRGDIIRKIKFSMKIQIIYFEKRKLWYNLGHNIFRLFDVLPDFYFITSEANRDY